MSWASKILRFRATGLQVTQRLVERYGLEASARTPQTLKLAVQDLQSEQCRLEMKRSASRKFATPSVEAVLDTKQREQLICQSTRYLALVDRAHLVSAVHLPGERDPDAVTIEHVHKDLALLCGATYDSAMESREGDTLKLSDKDIIISSRWICQRTPVRMGLDMSRLGCVITASPKLLDSFLQTIEQGVPSSMNSNASMKSIVARAQQLGFTAWPTHTEPQGCLHDFTKIITLDRVQEASVNDSVSIQLFDQYSDDSGVTQFTTQGSAVPIMAALYKHFLTHLPAGGHVLDTLPERDFHWFLAYALTHPSDFSFDRLVREFGE